MIVRKKAKVKFDRTAIYMDTIIRITVITSKSPSRVHVKINRVFDIFHLLEMTCSRFEPNSELRQLSSKIGIPVNISEILFQAILFSLEMAKITDGAFDPTIGLLLEEVGFDRNYRTGNTISYVKERVEGTSFKDVLINQEKRTVMLLKPLILDLGAVVKGLAIDLARKELEEFESFSLDAGGDIFAKGCNEENQPWTVGIRDPIETEKIIYMLTITDAAVCTSGGYERRSNILKDTHHLLHPSTEKSCHEMLSCTAIAPFAMMADSFSTAAFILGQKQGLLLLEENGVEGLMVTPSKDIITTRGIERYQHVSI